MLQTILHCLSGSDIPLLCQALQDKVVSRTRPCTVHVCHWLLWRSPLKDLQVVMPSCRGADPAAMHGHMLMIPLKHNHISL